MGRDIFFRIKPYIMKWLNEEGVTCLTNVKIEAITDKGIEYTDKEGKRQTMQADTVVLAAGSKPNAGLLKKLEGKPA